MLAHLLHLRGVESVVVEARDRDYVQQRVRAGVLEQGTVDLLVEMGLGERLKREGLVHEGLELRFGGRGHRIALSDLTGGRAITIYGQQEVVKDLIDAREEQGAPLLFEVEDVSVDVERPRIAFSHEGAAHALECDFVAGCDGFHGVTRGSVPDGVLTEHEHVYPFAWLGSSRRSRRRPTSSSTATTSAASRCTACARRSCRGCTCRSSRTTTSPSGPTSGSGRSCRRASPWTTAAGR